MDLALARRARSLAAAARNAASPQEGPRVFGMGAAKTGTHTLGEMFAPSVPSAHEADAERLISLYLDGVATGRTGALRRYMRWRDLKRRLRIDASQVNIYLVDEIESLFPGSLYVLTVREPRSWLRSITDDSLRREVSPVWMRFRDYRFGGAEYRPEDAPLRSRGLYPLAGYLAYWRHSIESAVARLPADRLLAVRTDALDARAADIAAFCGIEASGGGPVHAFANPERFGVLEELDAAYLEAALETAMTDTVRTCLDTALAPEAGRPA